MVYQAHPYMEPSASHAGYIRLPSVLTLYLLLLAIGKKGSSLTGTIEGAWSHSNGFYLSDISVSSHMSNSMPPDACQDPSSLTLHVKLTPMTLQTH